MRPCIAEILEHNGRAYTLPIPAKLRELNECVRALGLKDGADEDDMRVVGYKSLFVPTPGGHEPRRRVLDTAENLAGLNDAQIKAVTALCGAFPLTFDELGGALNIIHPNMEVHRHEETE
jgi:hypothetical protein